MFINVTSPKNRTVRKVKGDAACYSILKFNKHFKLIDNCIIRIPSFNDNRLGQICLGYNSHLTS